jgi:hypothetical protein
MKVMRKILNKSKKQQKNTRRSYADKPRQTTEKTGKA